MGQTTSRVSSSYEANESSASIETPLVVKEPLNVNVVKVTSSSTATRGKRRSYSMSHSGEGESVTDDVERSIARSSSEGKLSVSMRFSHIQTKSEPSSLGEFPHFLRELQADKNILIACYNPLGRLDYLSDGVYQTMGYDVNAPLEDISFPITPCRGSVFFRQHVDGSLVKFHNTFKSKLCTGEQFTMDEIMPTSEVAPLTLLVNPATCVVSHHKGDTHFMPLRILNGIIGKSLCEISSPDSINSITESFLKATQGCCSYNVSTQLLDTSVRVSMDFFPCSNGHSVVLVTPLDLNDNNCGMGSLLHDKNAPDVGDDRLRPSCLPSALEVFSMERRLHDLNNEIKYLRDFRDNVIQPIFSVSSEGRVIWANHAMLTLMGFENSPHEFIDSMVIAYHVDPVLMATMISMLLDGQLLVNFPCNLRRRSGGVLNVTFNSNAKFDSDGNFLYSRCVVLDMTEQNKLRRVRDELIQNQTVAATKEKEAIAASNTKSEFLAVMSHELRTPINGVLGATSLLGITTLDEDQRDYVNTITDSADILLSLVSNILDISKIEVGKLELDKVPLRLVDIVKKCTVMLQYRASEKGLKIASDIDPELCDPGVWYRGDLTRINQVLLNFMSNAVKFTDSGSVQCNLIKLSNMDYGDDLDAEIENPPSNCDNSLIGISDVNNNSSDMVLSRRSSASSCSDCSVTNKRYDWLRFEVVDTGCGISDCSILFAPFVQADDTIHRKYGGTGLGLNISKKIVEMMHGRIGISSVVGVGTTVWAEFPLRRVAAPRKAPDFEVLADVQKIMSRCESIESDDEATRSSKVRILIAEDNKVNQKVLRRMLETLGYTDITVTNNGQEAVDAFKAAWENYLVNPRSGRFDIVLMDCLMPVMDGWTATEGMRSLEVDFLRRAKAEVREFASISENKPTIILALTANATSDDKLRCGSCGMDDFYTKPMPRDGLNAMMLRWVSKLFSDSDTASTNSYTDTELLDL